MSKKKEPSCMSMLFFIAFLPITLPVYIIKEIVNNRSSISSSSSMSSMSGVQFEKYCGSILKSHGYTNIRYTPTVGDQGVDIIANKNGTKYAIQCKCYKNSVGNTPIQEVYAGMIYYKCDRAMVMTNSRFTDGAKILAKETGVLLWDNIRI